MSVEPQVRRLVDLGVPALAGMSDQQLASRAETLSVEEGDVLVVHPECVPASVLAPLLRHQDRPGFVVTDLDDLDEFRPIEGVELPQAPVYVVCGVERGDENGKERRGRHRQALIVDRPRRVVR